MNNNIKNYNFIYNKETELEPLNKLKLKNVKDLKIYLSEIFNVNLNENIKYQIIETDNNNLQIIIIK